MRIDRFLAEKYGFSRNKIQQFIASGLIEKNNATVKKPSESVHEGDQVIIIPDRRIHWVSRSAEKLWGFLGEFPELQSFISWASCLDVGASTGGFSQVLLEMGASHIDAVDVGTDQLDQCLRNDARVDSYEQTDIRHFASDRVPYDIIVCDASFISLGKILDSMVWLAGPDTEMILLFKPQFEVEKHLLTRSGVPKNEWDVRVALERFEATLQELNMDVCARRKSTLLWEAGNQEWVYWIRKSQMNAV